MLSRVADSLYWMSRYLERAEHTARVLDVHLHLMLDQDEEAAQRRWKRVLQALDTADWESDGARPSLEALTFSSDHISSIVASIGAARENARQIREQISSEMFEELNRLYLYVRNPRTRERFSVEPHAFYVAVKEGAHLFQGITDSTMTHGQGWQFIQAGRYLERALLVASLLSAHLTRVLAVSDEDLLAHTTHNNTFLELLGLLKSCTGWEAYCKVYSAELQTDRLAEFLLLNSEFPHSVHHAVVQLEWALGAIAQETGQRQTRWLDNLVGRMRATLRYQPIQEWLGDKLEGQLSLMRQRLAEVHEGLFRLYMLDHFEWSEVLS